MPLPSPLETRQEYMRLVREDVLGLNVRIAEDSSESKEPFDQT